jgi:spermidine/putrescine transport system ATP-binding protein
LAGIVKRFGELEALAGVSLDIQAGEFLSLLGPSGSGKTTLMRVIGGFERADAGTVELSGRDVTGIEPTRRDVNTVFQSYALFPHMTVQDNVGYGLKVRRVARAERRRRVAEALAMVRLDHAAHRKPRELSGGMQQRVALARALVNRPSVLLLDEPLAALDRKLREDMQIELRRLQRTVGTTFVYVTHDQDEALAMSDRIAVMNHGRIEQLGRPLQVYDEPASLWVAGFVGKSNQISGTVRTVAGGRVIVATDVAEIHADRPHGPFAPGDAVGVVIRPERVRIGREPAYGPNQVEVIVRQILSHGHQNLYVGYTAGGLEMTASMPRSESNTDPVREGESACFGLDAASVHVYAESGRPTVGSTA